MTCITCKTGKLEAAAVVIPQDEVNSGEVAVKMAGLRCPNCGYVTVKGSDMPEYMRLTSDIYRDKIIAQFFRL